MLRVLCVCCVCCMRVLMHEGTCGTPSLPPSSPSPSRIYSSAGKNFGPYADRSLARDLDVSFYSDEALTKKLEGFLGGCRLNPRPGMQPRFLNKFPKNCSLICFNIRDWLSPTGSTAGKRNAEIYARNGNEIHEEAYCETAADGAYMVMRVADQVSTPVLYKFSDLLAGKQLSISNKDWK